MAEREWYATRRADQRAMYANVLAKIRGYEGVIDGLDSARAGRIELMCQTFIAVYDWLEQCESRLTAAYEFQKDLERGAVGEPVNAPPAFSALVLPARAFKGFVTEFRKEIGLLKKQTGYTQSIGEDLMIVAEKGEAIAPEQRQPAFKYEVRQGFRLNVTGSMQGMRAANFYYRRKGQENFVFVGYLTRTPGEIHIPPAQSGTPETGEIKAVFSENNEETGQFSTNTEVTLS